MSIDPCDFEIELEDPDYVIPVLPGVPGPKGDDGEPGPPGDGVDDPGDITLIFNNGLI